MNNVKILDRIMNSDFYVRFAVIADADGNEIDSRIRDGITNFLPSEEMRSSIQRLADSWKFRKNLTQFVGKNQYVLAVYEKVNRITIPLGEKHILLVALDNRGSQKGIIEKIMAIIGNDYTKPITSGPQY